MLRESKLCIPPPWYLSRLSLRSYLSRDRTCFVYGLTQMTSDCGSDVHLNLCLSLPVTATGGIAFTEI